MSTTDHRPGEAPAAPAAAPVSWAAAPADLVARDVYMCGPPGLMTAVREALHEAGLPPRQLDEERFDL